MRFGTWLAAEMDKQCLSRREVARRLAAQHPKGATPATIETYRRAVRRYLDEESPMRPTAQTRRAFADALGVSPDEVPDDDEEEADLFSALLRELNHLHEAVEFVRAAVEAQEVKA